MNDSYTLHFITREGDPKVPSRKVTDAQVIPRVGDDIDLLFDSHPTGSRTFRVRQVRHAASFQDVDDADGRALSTCVFVSLLQSVEHV